MKSNLVIVESPAKAKMIEKFLGKDYKVMSSYGHIRDLKKHQLSVDLDSMQPTYEIPEDKKRVVGELRSNAKKASTVWLASDEDREGEAISWHLCEVLGLDEAGTKRIVFHEITKPAILAAIEHPRHIDMNLVNAQQARRVLDRIVGFKLSPVLWRKVKPSLSAGRVQSVAVRLIVEREREIQSFKSEPYYSVSAVFTVPTAGGTAAEVKALLDTRFKSRDEAKAFLDVCRRAEFVVDGVQQKPQHRSPAPPFTTSTLQQEAARKLGLTVSQTMLVAQHLYESGKITYMRTDSVNLSSLCINSSKAEIIRLYGEQYSRPRRYHTSSKGAQEAHEAIRPTYMNTPHIEGTVQERRLYELIWKRTIASQMAEALTEKTTVTIPVRDKDSGQTADSRFVATGEVITFDGFLKVYSESVDDNDSGAGTESRVLPPMTVGQSLLRSEITATEKFSQAPARYSEASLVHKMEELGIGRPSTYAPTISTIQQREYVHKGDSKGRPRQYAVDTLKGDKITSAVKTEIAGSDKGRLLPTDTGTVVNDFLMKNFPDVLDYNFTANVEREFDKIAEGGTEWTKMIREFYQGFDREVEDTVKRREEHRVGERHIGTDPESGRPVFAKIGRFGAVVQIGTADDDTKPRFAQMPKGKSIETITLDEALEAFRLPRTIGRFEDSDVVIGAGRFGPYVLHNKKFASLPKGADPMTVTLDEAIDIIMKKRESEAKKHIKSFAEDDKLEIKNGRFGPYISYDKNNYRLPKALHERAAEMTYEECMEIVRKLRTKN